MKIHQLTKFVLRLAANSIIYFHQSRNYTGNKEGARKRERERERVRRACQCLRSSAYIVRTSAYINVCVPRLPLLYLGQASSSLSSITPGKWNTFVSGCCMRKRRGVGWGGVGGVVQINVFN